MVQFESQQQKKTRRAAARIVREATENKYGKSLAAVIAATDKRNATRLVCPVDPLKEPHLVILVEVGRIPIKGGCSACNDVFFTTGDDIGPAQQQYSKLEGLFSEHFRKVHMHEDASQAAARAKRTSP